MGALGSKLRHLADGSVAFLCPGCGDVHTVRVGAGARPRWSFNGNGDRPTFSPSILVRNGHYVPNYDGGGCWCDFNAELIEKGQEPTRFGCGICHSFVTDGRIQFLSDCTHALAGQTVDLPDYPADAA